MGSISKCFREITIVKFFIFYVLINILVNKFSNVAVSLAFDFNEIFFRGIESVAENNYHFTLCHLNTWYWFMKHPKLYPKNTRKKTNPRDEDVLAKTLIMMLLFKKKLSMDICYYIHNVGLWEPLHDCLELDLFYLTFNSWNDTFDKF